MAATVGALSSIDRALQPLLSCIARREVLCAAAGLKPVRLMTPEADLHLLLAALHVAGLGTAMSDSCEWIAEDEGKGGWSSAAAEPGTGVPHRHVYVARTAQDAEALRTAEASGSSEAFGKLLLVPACCRAMFAASCREAAAVQNDFIACSFPAACTQVPWKLNLAAQYFDAALISHYPCSANCTDSLRLAELAWRLVRHAAPGLAKPMRAAMEQTALYTERQGVHLLGADPCRDHGWVAWRGAPPRSTALGWVAERLARGDPFRVPEPGCIEWRRGTIVETTIVEGARLLVPHHLREEPTP